MKAILQDMKLLFAYSNTTWKNSLNILRRKEGIFMSVAYDKTTPHRFDVVGSFLRPAVLKEARQRFGLDEIDRDALTAAEDAAIRDLVAKQQAAGLGVITDGEFRRTTWHLDFMWAFDGVGHSKTETGLPFQGEDAMIDDTYLTGKVRAGHHPFVDHFAFVQALEDESTVAKLTMPAPAQFFEQMIMPMNVEGTRRFYAKDDDLIEDLAAGYRAVLAEAYAVGCRNVQFDDCSWGVVVDPRAEQFFGTDAAGIGRVTEQLLTVNNLALQDRPADLRVSTHVCRGNFHSTWACVGGYDRVAETLFKRENVDAFFLEFDDERSGGFEPLSHVPDGKKVVLGLITTKSPQLEDAQAVIARIHEAARYVPIQNLCLSPQCGFASCEIGNKVTEEEQWAKIALVKRIAEEVWG